MNDLQKRIEEVRALESEGFLPTAEDVDKVWECPHGDGFETRDPNRQLAHEASHHNQ